MSSTYKLWSQCKYDLWNLLKQIKHKLKKQEIISNIFENIMMCQLAFLKRKEVKEAFNDLKSQNLQGMEKI